MIEARTVKAIFLSAIERDSLPDRVAFLDEACAGDLTLREQVNELLLIHDTSNLLLDQPAHAYLSNPPPDDAHSPAAPVEPEELDFLQPTDYPGSLGRLAHYEVLQVVGRGGMGLVLRAFDEKLHRVVAIKVLARALAGNGSARQRFLREARAAAAVTHDHVIDIHAVENEGRVPFLVMQFIDGPTLQEKLDRTGPLEVAEILRIGLQVAEGLAAAHRHGLIHRDIKPANILLENGIERVKITDFGLARAGDDAHLTQSGYIAGTPMYMSPEQARGEVVDQRTDLFSLGSVLYALCTGYPPFQAQTTLSVLRRVCEDTPRPLRAVNPELPSWLEPILARLHAKDPADRFSSAAEVASCLRHCLAQVQSGGYPSDTSVLAGREETARTGQPDPSVAPATDVPGRPVAGEKAAARTTPRLLLLAAGVALVAVILGGFVLWRPKPQGPTSLPTQDQVGSSSPGTHTNSLGMKLARVPKGTAWLGGHARTPGNRMVSIPADFYLGSYEVTQQEWQEVMKRNPSAFARTGADQDKVKEIANDDLLRFPVEMVAWDDAQAFLGHLNRLEQDPRWTYRLPTVVEWEYACHGGPMADPADSAFNFFLEQPTNVLQPGAANFRHEHALGRPCPVGSYRPNALGLYDMYGNIYEWTDDTARERVLTVGRVLRGGAFWLPADQLAAGVAVSPHGGYRDVGFRVARVPVVQGNPHRLDFDAWCKDVAGLPATEQASAVADLLRVRNFVFYDLVTPVIAAGVVTELSFITDNVTDLEPVRALTGLSVLRCGGATRRGQLADLRPLQGLPLTHLDCHGTLVADLAPLAGMKLTELHCANTLVTDLSPLRGLPLRVLTCDFQPERDTAILRSLKGLVTINDQPAARFWEEKNKKDPAQP